jgi:predicted GNAT superfamily acetyltransferase
MHLRDATPEDAESILRLNHASVRFLSPLTQQRLSWLHGMASYHRVVEWGGQVQAFLLAFGPGVAYDSPNYQWFARHFERFLYVDRIVVDTAAQGQGFAARLYEDLFVFARQNGAPRITLEIDSDPPNPVSSRFHARYGFREIGSQWVAGGAKRVSLQELPLDKGPDGGRNAA